MAKWLRLPVKTAPKDIEGYCCRMGDKPATGETTAFLETAKKAYLGEDNDDWEGKNQRLLRSLLNERID